MESPHKCSSFKNLVGTIESLLGSKSDLTVTWAQSVKLIIEDLSNSCPSTPCTPSFPEASIYDDNEKSGLEGELILLKAAYALSNVNRKLALNKLLDLKGNIRVFCRVRPLLSTENQARAGIVATNVPNEVLVSTSGRARHYKFDKVFQPASLQDDVFSEVEPIIRSAMDGSNVCIFAYGQTGTGKTFTMEGSDESPGIVPRTLQQLFFDASLDTTVQYSFKLSMLEVYRGSLRDLLASRHQQQQQSNGKSLCIQMAGSGCTEIENLTEVPIKSAGQARYLYRKGVRARSTCWTTANETSSRSHCLVRINITCNYGKQSHMSKLWLVDLGGSERFFKTQAQGQTLEEGKAINASLSALGDVISALQRKQPHIPYRNSKLTQILRDCLGKDSKALMLVHVSPREEDVAETLCSLGFASRARGIHLGRDLAPTARDERSAIMADILNKMKKYEDECQKLNENIQMVESLIQNKSVGGIPAISNEDLDELQLRLTGSCDADKKQLGSRTSSASPSLLPRFMTPTVSSQRKKRGIDVEKVVSVMMETTEKRVFKPGTPETRQVRRTLNFQVVSNSQPVQQEAKNSPLQPQQQHETKMLSEQVVQHQVQSQKAGRNGCVENSTSATSNNRRLLNSSKAKLPSVGRPAKSGWEDFGKKSSKCRRRWTLECSSRISITKRL